MQSLIIQPQSTSLPVLIAVVGVIALVLILISVVLSKILNKKLRQYMIKYLVMMMTVSSVFLIKINTPESLETKDMLWEYLKKQNHWIYRQMNKYFLGVTMKMKSWAGRKIIILGYAISQKIYGFN